MSGDKKGDISIQRASAVQRVVVRGALRYVLFFFQAEDGIRDLTVTGVQTCALPISPEPFEPAYEVWRLEFGVWSFSSPGLSNQIFFDELLVQVDAQAGPVRDRDPSVFRLQFFMRQFVAHGRVVHAVLEEERIAARGEP